MWVLVPQRAPPSARPASIQRVASEEPSGSLHGRLVERGPELLVVVGLVLIALGVALDREWLAALGVVTLMLGVVLPRMRGALEAGPGGPKVAEIIDANELRSRIQSKGRDLPRDARARAESQVDELTRGPRDLLGELEELIAEGILSETARKEWRVTFIGPLSDKARHALDDADDMILVSGHVAGGVESHSVIVNAATATEAVNRVRSVLEGTGSYHRWDVNEFEGGGFFGPRQDDGDE
jgi:hypothetical protein